MTRKRANGEGSIRKRKDGRWEGRYTAGHDPNTGKPIYKNVLGKTQAEVKVKLKSAMEECEKVDIWKARQYTVGQWMEVWFTNYAAIKVRPSSHQTYRGYIDHHIKPYIGDIPLTKLTTLDLQKMYLSLLGNGRVERIESRKQPKGLSAKTVRNINQVISSAMTFAIQQRLILPLAVLCRSWSIRRCTPLRQTSWPPSSGRQKRPASMRCITSSWRRACAGANCLV